jgi:hypothetical protein
MKACGFSNAVSHAAAADVRGLEQQNDSTDEHCFPLATLGMMTLTATEDVMMKTPPSVLALKMGATCCINSS